ncbi:hypothetical protein CHELA1G11_13883 [Hyphomicrobiales bacterium]|nr:hypothetical protein CHELA1G11_13883 [Hyphomicrobiales bacterium]
MTPSRDSSMPRPSTPRRSASKDNSMPSPQPTSSTRAPRSTISAISSRSTRCVVEGSSIAKGKNLSGRTDLERFRFS